MAIVLGGSPSDSSVASILSTPSLSSTPLAASFNGQGSASSFGRFKSPSVRSASINNGVKNANVSPSPAATAGKLVLSTAHTSAQSAKSIASSDNQTMSSSRPATLTHATLSSTHSGSVVAAQTLSTKASSSSKAPPSASPSPSSTAHQSSTPTKIANVSPNVSANATISKSSSAKSLPQSLTTGAANVTHTSTTQVFVPQISTSDTLPFTSTTLVPSPTLSLGNLAKPSGFFSNRGAVGGVFFVVALAVLGLAGLIFFGIRRYRRLRSNRYIREPTLPDVDPSSNDGDMHYRRASQMRALRDVLSAGASGRMPSSRRSITSDDSHTFTRDTHHSNSPIMPPYLNRSANYHADAHSSREYIEGHTNGYQNLIPFPPATKPFAQKSQVSVQSAVETSPSIYPPTLPSVADEDEERYWRQNGFERVSHSQDADRMLEKHAPVQQPTHTGSALGLWTNTSPTDSQGSSTLENELVRSMDPRMEPSVHKGSIASITVPPKLHLHDGRYPVVGSYTPAYRPPW